MKKTKQSLFWEVSHEAAIAPSYLFGTMHLLDERVLPLLDFVSPYLAKTELFMAETVIDEMNDLPQNLMFLPAGKNINDFLPMQKVAKIARAVAKYLHLDFESLRLLHPMFLLQIFASKAFITGETFHLDDLLWQQATAMGKPCLGIESVATQVSIFQAMDIKAQYQQLLKTIGSISAHNKTYKRLANLYVQNEAYLLYQQAKRTLHENRRTLLYDRNVRMTNSIAAIIIEKNAFVTFGAGHLLGEKGIVRLLQKKGFRLTPYFIG
jgi:uncharacterized protein